MKFVVERLDHYVAWADAEMAVKRVSESVIRGRNDAISARAKIGEALETMR